MQLLEDGGREEGMGDGQAADQVSHAQCYFALNYQCL